MKFHYYLPEFQHSVQKSNSYLPSMVFIVFSIDPKDEDERLQNVYARRLPQVMKTKIDMITHFNTSYILPLNRTDGSAQYLDSAPDSPFFKPEFVEQFERFDYLIEGSVSPEAGILIIKLYSRSEEKVILERRYTGTKFEFAEHINSFLVDLMNFFKITPTGKEKEKLLSEPTTNPKALELLLEALDQDPLNAVDNIDKEKYIGFLLSSMKEDSRSQTLPNYLTGYINKLLKSSKTEKAVEILEKVEELKPDNKKVVEIRTHISITRHQMDKALELLKNSISNNSELAGLPYYFAREIMQTDRAMESIPFFELAILHEPENPDIYDSFGYYYTAMEKYEQALEQFKKGMEISPYRASTLINTAQAYTDAGMHEEAKAIYEKLLTLYSESPDCLTSYAIYHAINRNFREASGYIRAALDLSPENPQINLTAARLFDFIDDRNNAERYAKTAIDLSNDKLTREEAQNLYSRIDAGISEDEQKKNRDLFLQAVILLRKNEIGEALKLIDKVVEVEPEFWRAWFLKGVTCRLQNDYDQALEAFDHVDELYPEQAYLRHEIAKCLMAQEKFVEAFPLLRFAFKAHPEDPEIMANMGLNYLYMGRLTEAETLLLQVKRMDPDNQNIESYLSEIERIKKKRQSSRGNGDTKD
ncbi:MAG: tetratricopeptide repeat protein [Firmicutes bacterium]|nr:tetratricopeptide repeat protein [Bacillota bacterium]